MKLENQIINHDFLLNNIIQMYLLFTIDYVIIRCQENSAA